MKIAYISTYLPRQCGIATFNHNLIQAINSNFPHQKAAESTFVVAINESSDKKQYDYPPEVKFVIRQERQRDYTAAAEYINKSGADACIVEHEFGIFGGESGIYILSLLAGLEIPVITVLHTVLREPSYVQKLITREISKYSAHIVVMSKRAVQFLTSIYGISEDKIKIIEHGVPDMALPAKNPVTALEPFKDKRTLFTFGLLSRNKGIETVIKALPTIIDKHPDVNYVILGNTHPGVLKSSGEEYRESLQQLAEKLGVRNHLHFINKFVAEEELIQFLAACHIYVTPYLNEAQITSGTLSYAIGAGAAVVSTPYWHAQELLDDNRGRLFNFKDFNALAEIITELLDNETKINRLRSNALHYGKHLKWPNIGRDYINLLTQAISKPIYRKTKIGLPENDELPAFSLLHIRRMTDYTGLMQHAKYGIPNFKEGYCLDDNARALILMLMANQQFQSKEPIELIPVYLSYIHYMQREDGYFRNFLSFNRNYLDEKGSEDSFGRTIWALGFLINSAPNNSYREFGQELFKHSIPHFKDLKYLRGAANTLIGISLYLKAHPSDERMMSELDRLTSYIVSAYKKDNKNNWQWFEDVMTYDNAILPLALMHSAEITANEEVKNTAFESMVFLEKVTFQDNCFSPVGNDGWLHKGKPVPVFDQQAIETMGMVLLYYQAYHLTQNPEMLRKMNLCFMWFHGYNKLRVPLYDPETRGCCDGLQKGKLNRNQGAESTLAYLISHLTVLKALDEMPAEYKSPEKRHKPVYSK